MEDLISWLMGWFDTHKIYAHVDTDTKDVWLNLDWWADHPGGPFYEADEYAGYPIRDEYQKTPVNPAYPAQITQDGHIVRLEDDGVYQSHVDGVDGEREVNVRLGSQLNDLARKGHSVEVW